VSRRRAILPLLQAGQTTSPAHLHKTGADGHALNPLVRSHRNECCHHVAVGALRSNARSSESVSLAWHTCCVSQCVPKCANATDATTRVCIQTEADKSHAQTSEARAVIRVLTAHRESDGEALQDGVHHDAEHDQDRGGQVPADPAGAAPRLAHAGSEVRLVNRRCRLAWGHGALLCCLRALQPLSRTACE